MTDTASPAQGALSGVQLHRVDCIDDALEFKRWLGERRPILACDTETTGLDKFRDRIRLVQFGDTRQGWTIPWDDWAGVAREAFRDYEDHWAFHNLPFDALHLDRVGIQLPRRKTHDTMTMAHVLDPTQHVGLKGLATVHIDPTAYIGEAMLEKAMSDGGWTWATIPVEVPAYGVYAAMDCVLTAHVFTDFYPKVMQDCPAAYDLEMAFAWCMMRMMQRGARLDVRYAEVARADFQAYVEQCDAWCVANYQVRPSSDVQLAEALQREGVELTKRTKGGRLSVDKEVLEDVIATTQHPLAQVALTRRRAQKLLSTYLENFLDLRYEDDRLRADMRALGAKTGRMSIGGGIPLQTLPRRSENNPLAITIRNCIVPTEGNILLMSDFDQIEARVLSYLTGDTRLAAAFLEGDFFCNIATEIWGQPIVKGDERRQHTKNGWYAKSYGAGVAKFALTAGIDYDLADQFMQALDQRFPGIRQLQQTVEQRARERGVVEGRPYVRSPLTNRKWYPADREKLYVLVNYLIQGMSAEILKMKTVELDAAGFGDYMTLLVHDEVMMDIPRTAVRDAIPIIDKVMNDAHLLTVPLTAATEFGYRWGEKGAVKMEEVAL